MIVMLDTGQPLDVCGSELGCEVEQLLTPLTRRNPQKPDQHFAIDNGAYSKFEVKEFASLLEKHKPRIELCRWVAVPDVVGSARRTLECWDHWSDKLRSAGWRLAFVCQDGQENLTIPWKECDAVFVGGTTDWKMSRNAAAIVAASRVIGKWCHIGRINTPGRFEYFESLGADSCDGTGLARYSHMREKIARSHAEPKLL